MTDFLSQFTPEEVTYTFDVRFRCRRLTQQQGRQFWEYASHFGADTGVIKDEDRSAYRLQMEQTAPRLASAIGLVLSLIWETSSDEDAEIVSMKIEKVE